MQEQEHSAFGGSVATRVLNCKGSTNLLKGVPAQPGSSYAAEGILAHEFAAWCLENGEEALNIIGATMSAEVGASMLTEEMAKHIQVYLDEVRKEMAKSPDAVMFVEQRFRSEDDPDVFGTVDCIVYHPSLRRIVGFDFKYGVGIHVAVEDNDQTKFYLSFAIFELALSVQDIEMVIVQPRDRFNETEEDAVRRCPLNPMDVLEFKVDYLTAVAEHKAGGELTAGPWCDKTFCDGRTICPAYQARALAATGFEDVVIEDLNVADLPEPNELSMERLAAISAGLGRLVTWANSVQEYLQSMVLGGTHVPGWKVVDSMGKTKWIGSQKDIAAELSMMYDIDEDLVLPRKLETITNVLAMMKESGATKQQIEAFKKRYTLRESTGLTAAPDSDKREAVDAAKRAFGGVKIE